MVTYLEEIESLILYYRVFLKLYLYVGGVISLIVLLLLKTYTKQMSNENKIKYKKNKWYRRIRTLLLTLFTVFIVVFIVELCFFLWVNMNKYLRLFLLFVLLLTLYLKGFFKGYKKAFLDNFSVGWRIFIIVLYLITIASITYMCFV